MSFYIFTLRVRLSFLLSRGKRLCGRRTHKKRYWLVPDTAGANPQIMRSDFLTLKTCSLFVARLRLPHAAMMHMKGENTMAVTTRRDLQTRIKELETENEELQSQLDEISDIVAPVQEDEDEEEGDEESGE